jgi:NAD(P)-dependent dehydrogenase (short-subunit alcohol dehydrogenase family)
VRSEVLLPAPSRLRGRSFFSPGASGHRSKRSLRTSSPPADPPRGAEVDALDEQAVDKHPQSVIDKAGRVDISFNAVGIPDAKILGVPLVELDVEQFSLPLMTYATSYFLTASLAGRRMVANKSGVIMTVTALHSRTGIPLVGGYGPAQAAK